ncbi:hypothetical protein, partial [Veronia pacifica]
MGPALPETGGGQGGFPLDIGVFPFRRGSGRDLPLGLVVFIVDSDGACDGVLLVRGTGTDGEGFGIFVTLIIKGRKPDIKG